MPIDAYAALNAMLRAEVTRFTPPVRKSADPAVSQRTAGSAPEPESEPQQSAAADSAA
ncbi:hypothetical protein AB0D66_01945 [Streptomyces sp. NPDC048270]|uniref:hypothetical protein n=1 Tax=Streptomyces sp. NPDC048270 TaxID=3154615 RepID=UPI0033C575EE